VQSHGAVRNGVPLKVGEMTLGDRTLPAWLHGTNSSQWRQFVISEYNYASLPVAEKLRIAPRDACLFTIADRRWK
jgi:hypothetical protein